MLTPVTRGFATLVLLETINARQAYIMETELLKHFLFKTPLPDILRLSQYLVTLRKHEILIREGALAQVVYLLYRGKVQLIKKHSNGQQYVMTTLSTGSTVGVPAVLTQSCYTSTAIAASLVCACPLPRDTFLQFLSQYPQSYQFLAEQLAHTVIFYEKNLESQQELC